MLATILRMIPSDIVKVRFFPAGARQAVVWYGKGDGRVFRRYNRDESLYGTPTKTVDDEHYFVVDPSSPNVTITPQVMSLHYGELRDASTETA